MVRGNVFFIFHQTRVHYGEQHLWLRIVDTESFLYTDCWGYESRRKWQSDFYKTIRYLEKLMSNYAY